MKHAYQRKTETSKSSSIIQPEQKEALRLNKYISSSGYCSRREADRFIEEGKVMVDNVVAVVGTKVFPHQEVRVLDFLIVPKKDMVYIALHKPVGITCTTDIKDKDNIIDFLNYQERVFPIGRLDKESSGLILMTNNGDIVNRILRSDYEHKKEYIVSVNNNIDDNFLKQMQEGVKIYNPVNNTYQITKRCEITKLGSKRFRLVLIEGLNRQIRRMCTALGFRVLTLERTRVMNIQLGDLKQGEWRYISEEEQNLLNDAIYKNN